MKIINLVFLLALFASSQALCANQCSEQAIAGLDRFSKMDASRFPSLDISWREGGELSTEGENIKIHVVQFGEEKLIFISAVFSGHGGKSTSYQYFIEKDKIKYVKKPLAAQYICNSHDPGSSLDILVYVQKKLKEKGVDLPDLQFSGRN